MRLIVLCLLTLPLAAHAELTGSVTLASDYVYRGLTQTGGKPAIQAALDYAHADGWYGGMALSNVSWYGEQNAGSVALPVPLSSPGPLGAPYSANQFNSNSLEWDFYGGWKRTFREDWNVDLGAIRYWYPGTYDNVGAYRKPHTTEVYGALGWRWLTLKYSKGVSENTFGTNESRGASYLDLSAALPVGEGFNLLLHAGHQRYPNKANTGYFGASGGNNTFYSYTDYKVGLSKEWQKLNFALAWTRSNTKATAPDDQTTAYRNVYGENIGGSRVAATVTRAF